MEAQFCNRELSLRNPLPLDDLKALMGLAPAWDLIILPLTGGSSQLAGVSHPQRLLGVRLLSPHTGSQVTVTEIGGDAVAGGAGGRATF